jgi:hypothetical protein
MLADLCQSCGASGGQELCPECGSDPRAGADEVCFERVTWRRGELPVPEMKRRLARRLATQMAVLDRWAAQALAEQVVPEPVLAPPVSEQPPQAPRPPRFHIPTPAPRPETHTSLSSVQSLLLERLGWFVGGFLVVAGAVFLLGTVWQWLSPLLRVAAEQGLLVAAAAGLGLTGAWLVQRQIAAGRGLAAVGLALSAVVSVPTGVEGLSPAGVVGLGLGAGGALLVARIAARAGLGPLPPALWALGTALPAVVWLLPALAWPVLLVAAGIGLALVRQTLFGPPHPARLPVLGAWGAVLGASLLAVLPALGSSVGWFLAALGGASLLWVDAAQARWHGVTEPSFSRPMPVLGLSMSLASLIGLLSASVGGGVQALGGGLLGLLLVGLVAVVHGLPWLARTGALASLFVPAALATVLGLGGGGALSGWFLVALLAVPPLLWAASRLQAPLGQAVLDMVLLGGLLACLSPVDGTWGGRAAVVLWAAVALGIALRWGRKDALWVGHGLLAVAVAAVLAGWREDLGLIAAGWALLALAAEGIGRSVRERTRGAEHEAGRLGVAWGQIAPVQALLATFLLLGGRVLEPTVSVVVGGVLLGLAWALVGWRLREQAVGLALLVPVGVAASCVRPLLGLHSDPSVGLVVGTTAVLAAGALAARDRGPFRAMGTPFQVGDAPAPADEDELATADGRGPVGWLASPLWRVGQAGWLVLVGVGLSLALQVVPLVELRLLGLALGAALTGGLVAVVDRRATPDGAPARAMALGTWWVVATELSLLLLHRDVPAGLIGAGVAAVALGLSLVRGQMLPHAAAVGLCAGVVALGAHAVEQGEDLAALAWLAAAAPLVVLAVQWRQVGFSWLALGLGSVGVGLLLAPWIEGPHELGLALSVLALGALSAGAALDRLLSERWGPGLLDGPVRAAGVVCASLATLLWLGVAVAEPAWPAARAVTLVAWLWCAALSRERWLRAVAGAVAGIEALLLAHGAGRLLLPEVPEVGAVALAALGTLAVASRGLGWAQARGRWWLGELGVVRAEEPSAGTAWWGGLLGALVPLGVVPAAVAGLGPLAVPSALHALPAAVLWGLGAAWALGASWPVVVAWGALLVALLPGGGLALAGLAAASAWTAALLRSFPSHQGEPQTLARAVAWQVLVPGAALAAAGAFALGAWESEPLGPTAALVALTALGLVESRDRPLVLTLAPPLVALFAGASLPLVAVLQAAGALALGVWEAYFRPGRLLVAQAAAGAGALAAAGAVLAGELDTVYLSLLLLALTGTLALSVARHRTEGWYTAAITSCALTLSVAVGSALGPASLGACLVVAGACGTALSARLAIPFRAAPAFALLGTVTALGAAPSHRELALVALIGASFSAGWGYFQRPAHLSALHLVGALLAVLVGLRLGAEVTLLDAALWIGMGGVLVGVGDAAARLPAGQPLMEVTRWTAGGAPLVGLCLAALATGQPEPAVWTGAAASLGLLYARFRDPPALALALGAADMAVATLLFQAGQVDPTLLVLPFALSLGGLSHLWRTRLPQPAVHAMRWSAAGLLYAVALAQLVLDTESVLMLVLVSLVGLGAGALLQVRAWIWSGTAFLVAVVGLQGARFGIEHQLGLGVLLSLAGVMVLAAMVIGAVMRSRAQTQ